MTKTVDLYQVDSFATEVFRGNPAAVCPLDGWLDDAVMQTMAVENNLSETAFLVPDPSGEADFHLRWFTPAAEVDLCGHATLATAWVLFFERGFERDVVTFTTRSGILSVVREADGRLTMDFPQTAIMPAPHPDDLVRALGGNPVHNKAQEFWRAKNDMCLALLPTAEAVRNLQPNMAGVLRLSDHGLIVTAPGGEAGPDADVDFVSRFFCPQVGIPEDPVTGSAHTVLAPYWAKRLKTDTLAARQVSARGGDVHCKIDGGRVKLAGRAVLFFKGAANLPGA